MHTRRTALKAGAAGAAALMTSTSLAQNSPQQEGLLPQPNETSDGKYRPRYRFGLGGAPIGGTNAAVSDEDALKILSNAWDAGVRMYDTSPWYGLGLSERRFGMLLHDKPRDSYVLSTKVGRVLNGAAKAPETLWANPDSFDYRYDYSADGVRRSVEDSLQRLGVSSLDIVYIHDLSPDNGDIKDSYRKYMDQAVAGAMPALSRMREEGMIKGWGMGVNTLPPILEALQKADPDVCLAACQYTLMDHSESLEKLFPACDKSGVSIMVGSPLNNGFLTGRSRYNYSPKIPAGFNDKRSTMEKIAKDYGTDLRTAALQFCAAPSQVSCVIPGASQPRQILENVKSMETTIAAEFWVELKDQGLIDQNAPVPSISS